MMSGSSVGRLFSSAIRSSPGEAVFSNNGHTVISSGRHVASFSSSQLRERYALPARAGYGSSVVSGSEAGRCFACPSTSKASPRQPARRGMSSSHFQHAKHSVQTSSSPPSSSASSSFDFSSLPTLTTCILAHVDAGKSTLADRLLEMTGTISKVNADDPKGVNRQVLDTLQVERQRGITVKSQAVSMIFDTAGMSKGKGKEKEKESWLINLIDTPGHVDVSSSTRTCCYSY